MEMYIEITIKKIEAKVKLAPERTDNIRAFGELHLYTLDETAPFCKVKGFTIRVKVFNEKPVLVVTFPAYPAGGRFLTSFYLPDKILWERVNKLFLDEYAQMSGDLPAGEIESITDEDLDNIAKALDKENEKT